MTDEKLPAEPPAKKRWYADFLLHKVAYGANLFGLLLLFFGAFWTAQPPFDSPWLGPVALAIASVLITSGFVRYQKDDSNRTDERLNELQRQLTVALGASAKATAALKTAATELDAARDAVTSAAEAVHTSAALESSQESSTCRRRCVLLTRWR